MIVVVAEKPSVARDIASVLGANVRKQGWIEGNDYCITWAIGHLVGLAQPGQMDERWGFWNAQQLPMLPKEWKLAVLEKTQDQFKVVKRLLCDRKTRGVVCATDAGREGELIWRYIYRESGATCGVKRLWISSLTADAIRRGFEQLKPSAHYDNLASAARARSQADWLVGMNLSRAYTLATGDTCTVGRVQTPTLAMIVARDKSISSFKPQGYREVVAQFATPVGPLEATYTRRTFEKDADGQAKESSRLPAAGASPMSDTTEDADAISSRATSGHALVTSSTKNETAYRAPPLFDLTELQRTANRQLGFTAAHTLLVAQRLYAEYKVLSYPRTDSRHLSRDVAETLPVIVKTIAPRYAGKLVEGTGRASLDKRFVDDGKVSDHHAIIPTGTDPCGLSDGSDDAKLYDLVCRRLLAAWQPDYVEATSVVDLEVVSGVVRDRYVARGTVTVREGWRSLEPKQEDSKDEPRIPAGVVQGMAANVSGVRILEKQTRPPPHFTEATLLRAMETAGASLADELSDAMRERGLGTPATRAATIETLLERGYMERTGKTLHATVRGEALIVRVHPHVRSPAMTGEWEARLKRLERGQETEASFMKDVEVYVGSVVGEALKDGVAPRVPSTQRAATEHATRASRSRAKPKKSKAS